MDIERRFTAPDNWQWDYFTREQSGQNNHKIRYGFCNAANPRALAVIAPGRAQTSEEYFEFARDLLKRDFSVAIMDWQGHGGSYHLNDDYTRHHSIGFTEDIEDFKKFLEQLARMDRFQKLQKFLVAHSMGGNLTLRYMADEPETFKCAIMVAPMIDIKINGLVRLAAGPILTMAHMMGWKDCYAPGQSQWSETMHNINKHFLSSDPIRREVQKFWYQENPELQCGGVTFGWLDEAFKSIDYLEDPGNAARITTPTFFAIAEDDIVVCNQSTEKMVAKMPASISEVFAKSKHVILMEQDPIRNKFMKSFYSFTQKHLHL